MVAVAAPMKKREIKMKVYKDVVIMRADGGFKVQDFLKWKMDSKVTAPEKMPVKAVCSSGTLLGVAENFRQVDSLCICDLVLVENHDGGYPQALGAIKKHADEIIYEAELNCVVLTHFNSDSRIKPLKHEGA